MATNTGSTNGKSDAASVIDKPVRKLRAGAALVSVGALMGVFLVGAPGAGAATIDVTTTADGGAGSLRAAIAEANANPGLDTIQLPAGTYTLSIAGRDEDDNETGDLDILDDLTIVGAGAGNTVIDGGSIDRVLEVWGGTTTVQGVTIAHGDPGSGGRSGGGIAQREGNLTVVDSQVRDNRAWSGGGISSDEGLLAIRNSEIVSNVVQAEPGNGSTGAGITKWQEEGSLEISGSLVADNEAIGGNGGGLYTNAASVSVVNTTFSGNSEYHATVLFERWGDQVGPVSLQFVTIAGNEAVSGSAGILSNVGPGKSAPLGLEGVLLQDNAVAQAPGENCVVQNAGAFQSLGSNLSDDGSCSLTQPTDRANDTLTTLGSLAANGGATRTVALLAGSSAIDAATCNGSVATDQRGFARPGGPGCDIGAYEAAAGTAPTSSTSTSTTVAPTTTSTTVAPTTTSTTAAPTTTTAVPTTTGADATPMAVAGEPTTTSTVAPTAVVAGVEVTNVSTQTATGTLPVTGSPNLVRTFLLGVGLLAGGLALLLSSRRLLSVRVAGQQRSR